MSLAWVERFVGIPFANKGRSREGADCWGFCGIVYQEQAGIALPSYDEEYPNSAERKEISAIVAREAASALWMPVAETVDRQFVTRTQPRPLDIIWFRRGRLDAHAGIWLKKGLMLHMREEDASGPERFDVPEWQSRVTGIYRWRALA